MAGKVYLVGAGLGDPGSLTVRAAAVLEKAEVVLIEDLVGRGVRSRIPPQAEVIPVGKRPGSPILSQEAIDTLLIQHCQGGSQVVYLKAGDPWLFGRSIKTIQALQQAGCAVEVIPGISAVWGAPGAAGIPITLPGVSESLAVISGHDLDRLNFQALLALDTLIVLMGSRTLPDLCQRLMAHGGDPHTPVGLVSVGSRTQVASGSLAAPPKLDTQDPITVIIGEVVNHRLNWDPLPLAGQTVLVTRADTPQQNLRFLLEQAGAEVLEMPTLAITPPSSWQPLDQALTHLADYDWLILTSANAVTFFMARLHHHGCDSRALAGIQIAVVGEKTAQILEHYGLKPDCIPAEFVAAALLPHLTTAKRILFPRVESGGRDDLTTALRQQGSRVDEVPAYESRCPAQGDPAIWAACQAGEVQVITFTSSKTVQHFVQLWQQSGIPKTSLDGIKLAVIGPKTAATCRELLGRVDIQAQPYTLEGLVQSLIHSQAHP